MLDPELVAILVCPDCHQRLREEGDCLVCQGCRKRYPVTDGIPILLVEEAEPPKEP
jgi:hypothetical protein